MWRAVMRSHVYGALAWACTHMRTVLNLCSCKHSPCAYELVCTPTHGTCRYMYCKSQSTTYQHQHMVGKDQSTAKKYKPLVQHSWGPSTAPCTFEVSVSALLSKQQSSKLKVHWFWAQHTHTNYTYRTQQHPKWTAATVWVNLCPSNPPLLEKKKADFIRLCPQNISWGVWTSYSSIWYMYHTCVHAWRNYQIAGFQKYVVKLHLHVYMYNNSLPKYVSSSTGNSKQEQSWSTYACTCTYMYMCAFPKSI